MMIFERKILSLIAFSGLSCSSVFAERGVQGGLIMDRTTRLSRALGQEVDAWKLRRLGSVQVEGPANVKILKSWAGAFTRSRRTVLSRLQL